MSLLKNPLILALDVDNKPELQKLVNEVGDLVGAIKLGPRITYRYGADLVSELSKTCPVFVDNKYFDIPSTMKSAVQASFEAGATLVTVHALAGIEALTELAKLEQDLNKIRPFKILVVTILTSTNEKTISSSLQAWPIDKHVVNLVEDVITAGLDGIVCSGQELTLLKDKNIFKVTPGIRLPTDISDDQKRIMTPSEAINCGSSALVIGRPILSAKNPRQAVVNILESIK